MEDPATPLWQAYRQRRTIARRNALVEHYLPWAERLTRSNCRRLPSACDVEELRSCVWQRLIELVAAYQIGNKVPFEKFAAPRLRNAIVDELRRQGPLTRLVIERLRGAERFQREQGHWPNDGELAGYLGWTPAKLRRSHEQELQSLHLRARRARDNLRQELSCQLAGRPALLPDPDEFDRLTIGLRALERMVLFLRCYRGKNCGETAELLGLSPSGVSMMARAALKHLRARGKRDEG